MIREERLARMEDYINRNKYASVEELMACLKVSKATVRRDLIVLADEKRLTLTRGGAMSLAGDTAGEQAYLEKKSAHALQKERIGEAAASLVRDNSSVFIDAGTTTRAMVPFFDKLSGVNLMTNDIAIAADLVSHRGIHVTVTGGQMRPDFYTLRGYMAEENIQASRADIAFVGMDAVDASGCYIANSDEVGVKRRIMESAGQVVLLCDYGKFGRQAFSLVCPLSDINIIITNRELSASTAEFLRERELQLILV